MNIFAWFKAPPAIETIQDKEKVDKLYAKWRMRIFLSMFFGYIIFYTCRKNISVALPVMQDVLGYNALELGLLNSSLYLFYAIGKFVNGVVADNSNVKRLLPFALFVSALANILLVLSAYIFPAEKISFFGLPPFSLLLYTMAFFWGVNGWFQSMGFPPIAKNLSYWFCNKERGVKWSLWSSSHEIGSYLSLILSGFLITKFGWEPVFYIPALIAILYCFIFYINLQDKPESIGLPEIEKYKDPDYCEPVVQEENQEDKLTYFSIFCKYILKNPIVWLLAFAYIFVYVVRFGTLDWLVMYQVDEKQYSLAEAAKRLSFLPAVGVLGTIGAGFVSDKFFNGKRAPVNVICLFLLAICLYLFKVNSLPLMDYDYLAAIGVFTCGPQVLIGGLSAVESSSKKVASAVTGFCGMFGYIGAILSSSGTGYVVQNFGWNGAMWFWIASAFLGLAVCIILWANERKSKC